MNFLQKLFKSEPPKPKVVTVVSGLPRSGTSMMMKMLDAGGVAPITDNIRTADADNPKGYYEFERVKQMDKGDVEWVKEAQGKSVKVISQLLKYLPSGYQYRVIFMRREMQEIVASQKKMLINRGEDPDKVSDEEIKALFEKHLASVMTWLHAQPNVAVLYVHYNDMLKNPVPQAKRVNEFLGNNLNWEEMIRVVDPELYRNRKEAALN